jgi:hypothetical protein
MKNPIEWWDVLYRVKTERITARIAFGSIKYEDGYLEHRIDADYGNPLTAPAVESALARRIRK